MFANKNKPMTREEMDKKVQEMMEERARQDAQQAIRYYNGNNYNTMFQQKGKPITREEMDKKVREMMEDRARQDVFHFKIS